MISIGDIFFFAKSSSNGSEEGSSPHQDNAYQKAEWGELLLLVEYI